MQVFLIAMVFEFIPGPKHGLEHMILGGLEIGSLIKWVLTTPVQVNAIQYSGALIRAVQATMPIKTVQATLHAKPASRHAPGDHVA